MDIRYRSEKVTQSTTPLGAGPSVKCGCYVGISQHNIWTEFTSFWDEKTEWSVGLGVGGRGSIAKQKEESIILNTQRKDRHLKNGLFIIRTRRKLFGVLLGCRKTWHYEMGIKKLERTFSWHEKTMALNEKRYMRGE